MIRFVVVDEIHLVNHFGRTFRNEFGALKDKLFAPLQNMIPMMFITATCTKEICESFQTLLGVTISNQHWPSPRKMATRQIAFNLFYTTQPLRLAKPIIELILTTDPDCPLLPKKGIVYGN